MSTDTSDDDMSTDDATPPAPFLSASVFFKDVVPQLRGWCKRAGIPEWVVMVPPHLRAFSGLFADESLWPLLYGLQHDEKDIFRVRGPAGLQDWGDGEAQKILAVRTAALELIDAQLVELRKLPAAVPLDAASYHTAVEVLRPSCDLVVQYEKGAAAWAAGVEGKSEKLRRKQRKQPATEQATIDRLAKHIRFNDDMKAEATTLATRVATLTAAAAALPPAPAPVAPPPVAPAPAAVPTPTPPVVITLLEDARACLEKGFDISNAPASKCLAMCLASVFECSEWTVGSIAFTVDEAKVWQIREAVLRGQRDAYERGMIPIFVGADKAYSNAAHWDLEGFVDTS